MALELRVWGGEEGENMTRREGGKERQAGEGRLLGSVSLLDKLFIIFIARKISRERGRALEQSGQTSS